MYSYNHQQYSLFSSDQGLDEYEGDRKEFSSLAIEFENTGDPGGCYEGYESLIRWNKVFIVGRYIGTNAS